MEGRTKPNVLVIGTPAVGKSTLCSEVVKHVDSEWIEIDKMAKIRDCIVTYDAEYNCPIIDEDKIIDELEPILKSGGKLIEYHGCDFFPERWFDVVFVLRTENSVLYDRLKSRGYTEEKVGKNMECEIFQLILDEARISYDPSIVHELQNSSLHDMEKNIKRVVDWIKNWLCENENNKIRMFDGRMK